MSLSQLVRNIHTQLLILGFKLKVKNKLKGFQVLITPTSTREFIIEAVNNGENPDYPNTQSKPLFSQKLNETTLRNIDDVTIAEEHDNGMRFIDDGCTAHSLPSTKPSTNAVITIRVKTAKTQRLEKYQIQKCV